MSDIVRDVHAFADGSRGTVDTSEWLVRRRTCLEVPWPHVTQGQEWDAQSEDQVWLSALLNAGVKIASTRRPTLRYTLGGR